MRCRRIRSSNSAAAHQGETGAITGLVGQRRTGRNVGLAEDCALLGAALRVEHHEAESAERDRTIVAKGMDACRSSSTDGETSLGHERLLLLDTQVLCKELDNGSSFPRLSGK